jgi:hypothetical protein
MQLQNPFEMILERLNAIQNKVGDIDTIVRSGNIPPIRKERPAPQEGNRQPVKSQGGKK